MTLPASRHVSVSYSPTGGIPLSAEDAAQTCDTDHEGTVVDLALAGLAESGVDSELRQFSSVAELREFLNADQPVIVILRHPQRFLHAVVVCDVGEDAVTVMDPAQGELVTIAIARFESLWLRVQNEGLVVGTRQQPS